LWKIQPQWVVTPGKQTNKPDAFNGNNFWHLVDITIVQKQKTKKKLSNYRQDKLKAALCSIFETLKR
jgi:hypothetical protein